MALHAIQKLQELGGLVVACSDSDGVVYDPSGIDLPRLKEVKLLLRQRLHHYVGQSEATYVEGGNIWDIECDVALPCATQNELTGRDARALVNNGCIAVAEGANMPTTPAGIAVFNNAGIAFGPGKAANAGGVATSALEMQQNASRDSWTFAHTEARLAEIMATIHETCRDTAEEYGSPGNYLTGANIAGFLRATGAMDALGLV